MKKSCFILACLFSAGILIAQTDSSINENDLITLQAQVGKIKASLDSVDTEYLKLRENYDQLLKSQSVLIQNYNRLSVAFTHFRSDNLRTADSLRSIVVQNASNIELQGNALENEIGEVERSANQHITDLNNAISRSTYFWITAILAVAVLAVIAFVFLRKQIFRQSGNLEHQIQDTRKNLEEEGIKLDNKLIEILESQLRIAESTSKSRASLQNKEADHTLALKVADEIVRIEKNLSKLDKSIQGVKPLEKGIERIKDNFKANGYEMIQLLNVEYNDGMNIDVINFIDDNSIEPGKKIITKIIKPQVNYNDILIQRAQVDVSQN